MPTSLPPAARRALRSVMPALLLAGCALVSGCSGGIFEPVGDIARQQRNLIYISTGLMLLIIVPVMVLTVLFAWRYRKNGGVGKYDPDFDHSTPLELVIWAAPLLIITALGALTWASTHLLDPFRPISQLGRGRPVPRGAQPLRIQVVALDWKWLFIYPDQGIATVNELALPVDVPVRFDMTSTNMMNTFSVPQLAGMVYAMPGMRSTLHAVLNKTGQYPGQSANYSGAGFSDMRFRVIGLDRVDFARWVGETRRIGEARGGLRSDTFIKLAAPSEKVPVMRFASVEPDLFRRVVERCVEPGKPCMSQLMAHDAGAHGHGHGGSGIVPPGRDSAPLAGEKPEGALFKDNDEKGSSPHMSKPTDADKAPGVTKPGDPRNRNLSSLFPVLGAAARTARG